MGVQSEAMCVFIDLVAWLVLVHGVQSVLLQFVCSSSQELFISLAAFRVYFPKCVCFCIVGHDM